MIGSFRNNHILSTFFLTCWPLRLTRDEHREILPSTKKVSIFCSGQIIRLVITVSLLKDLCCLLLVFCIRAHTCVGEMWVLNMWPCVQVFFLFFKTIIMFSFSSSILLMINKKQRINVFACNFEINTALLTGLGMVFSTSAEWMEWELSQEHFI